jgi:hypothetical protein
MGSNRVANANAEDEEVNRWVVRSQSTRRGYEATIQYAADVLSQI